MWSIAPPALHGISVVECFAAGEFVQQLSPGFGIHVRGEQLVSHFAKLRDPGLVLRSKLLLKFLPESLREGWTTAVGGNRNL
jgi:hypothetical protein